jgi:hypothetical protein
LLSTKNKDPSKSWFLYLSVDRSSSNFPLIIHAQLLYANKQLTKKVQFIPAQYAQAYKGEESSLDIHCESFNDCTLVNKDIWRSRGFEISHLSILGEGKVQTNAKTYASLKGAEFKKIIDTGCAVLR